MKKITIISVIYLFACNTNKTPVIKNNISGKTFYGIQPCADCPGIEKRITFYNDSIVLQEVLYQERDSMPIAEEGNYYLKNDTIVFTGFPNAEDNHKFIIKSNDSISTLDTENQEVKGTLAAYYVLHTIKNLKTNYIKGTYINGDIKKNYFQKLDVQNIDSNNYSVNISFGNATKGCTFQGKGSLQGDRLFVDLKKHQDSIDLVMTITFRKSIAIIDVLRKQNLHKLMYFCGGGASLIGNYQKK